MGTRVHRGEEGHARRRGKTIGGRQWAEGRRKCGAAGAPSTCSRTRARPRVERTQPLCRPWSLCEGVAMSVSLIGNPARPRAKPSLAARGAPLLAPFPSTAMAKSLAPGRVLEAIGPMEGADPYPTDKPLVTQGGIITFPSDVQGGFDATGAHSRLSQGVRADVSMIACLGAALRGVRQVRHRAPAAHYLYVHGHTCGGPHGSAGGGGPPQARHSGGCPGRAVEYGQPPVKAAVWGPSGGGPHPNRRCLDLLVLSR